MSCALLGPLDSRASGSPSTHAVVSAFAVAVGRTVAVTNRATPAAAHPARAGPTAATRSTGGRPSGGATARARPGETHGSRRPVAPRQAARRSSAVHAPAREDRQPRHDHERADGWVRPFRHALEVGVGDRRPRRSPAGTRARAPATGPAAARRGTRARRSARTRRSPPPWCCAARSPARARSQKQRQEHALPRIAQRVAVGEACGRQVAGGKQQLRHAEHGGDADEAARSVTAPTTAALAASTRPRRGVAVSVRIMPELCSPAAALTPSTRKKIALGRPPVGDGPIGSKSRRSRRASRRRSPR
jgi:hypothetical protein